MKNQLTSIILPTYNGADRISRAIESVLNQQYKDWELIVVDDGSTDSTNAVVNAFVVQDSRIRYVRQVENAGIQKALNRGLYESRGVYVARIDDDDVWIDTHKLQDQVHFLHLHPGHVLVGTGVIVSVKGKEVFRYLMPVTDHDIRKRMLGKNCFVHSTVVFKKETALLVGGYSESSLLRHCEDYDLWLRLGMHGNLHNLPTYTTEYTLRPESLSGQHKKRQLAINVGLIRRYRDAYPKYVFWCFVGYIRFIAYGLYTCIPFPLLRHRLLKLYKQF